MGTNNNQHMYLFFDEYPGDIYQKNKFYGTVITHPKVDNNRLINGGDELERILNDGELKACIGYVRKTDIMEKYFGSVITRDGDLTGINFLWSTMCIYCIGCFLARFYKKQQLPRVLLFYDPKSMSPEHREKTHNEHNMQKIYKEVTGNNLEIKIQEGCKQMLGIKIADKVVRTKGKPKFKGNFYVKDFTEAMELNVKKHPANFRQKSQNK